MNLGDLVFGLSIGANFSSFNTPVSELGNDTSLSYDDHFRLGVNFSARTFYNFNNYLRLESGLSYNAKGEEYRKENNDVIIFGGQSGSEKAYHKTRFRVDYIEIPLILGLNLKKPSGNFNRNSIFLNIGFSAAFNVKSDISSNSYTPTGNSGGVFVDVEEKFRETPFDYAKSFITNFIVGLDFNIREMSNSQLIIGVLFNQTLDDIYEYQSISSDYNYKTSNRTFTLRLGINFK